MPEQPKIAERPIVFSGQMILSLPSGLKTKSRRLIRSQPSYPGISSFEYMDHPFGNKSLRGTPAEGMGVKSRKVWVGVDSAGNPIEVIGQCPYGKPGDWLWVKETWRTEELESGLDGIRYKAGNAFLPIASTQDAVDNWVTAYREGWRSPRYMPRWASRISLDRPWSLQLVYVRPEKLQDITDEDAIAEGIEVVDESPVVYRDYTGRTQGFASPRSSFRTLWDSIHKEEWKKWESNPAVWALSVKIHNTQSEMGAPYRSFDPEHQKV